MTKLLPSLAALSLLFAACADDAPGGPADPPDDPSDPAPVARVEVSAPAGSLDVGATLQLAAITYDEDGAVLAGRPIVWSTSDGDVATVSAGGLVTAAAPGPVFIRATSEQVTAAVELTVHEVHAPVARLEVSPSGAVSLAPGATLQLSATAYDLDDEVLFDRAVSWQAAAPAIATVSATGVVTAVATGETTITATSEGTTATVQVVVEPPPPPVAWIELSPHLAVTLPPDGTHDLDVVAHAADGSVLTGRDATWTSSEPAIASIDAAGVITGHVDGVVRITATVEGQTAQLTVTVATVTHVEVSHGEAVMWAGDRLQLWAFPVAGELGWVDRPLVWSSDAPTIASIDEDGIVTALGLGLATLTATSDGVVTSIRVLVTPRLPHELAAVDGAALPATFYTYQETIGGVTRDVRVELTGGTLRVRHTDPRFALELWGVVHRAGEAPVVTSFEYLGAVGWDAVLATATYTPDEGGAPMRGWLDADGSVRLRVQLAPEHPAVMLRFDRP